MEQEKRPFWRRWFAGSEKNATGPPAGAVPHMTLDNPLAWMNGEDSSLSCESAMKISTVSRCVELRSNTIANLPIYLMDERSKERIVQHRLGGILWDRPNEAMCRFDFEKLLQVNRDLKGNAYAWIVRDPRSGYPVEEIPLPPDFVLPKINELGRLVYRYIDPRLSRGYEIPAADMIHYKGFSYDGITGVPILQRAAQTLQTAESAARYEQAMYDNGGRPAGTLTTDADIGGEKEITLPDGEKKTMSKKEFLRNEWERVHGGAANAFRVAVLDNGLKYQTIAVSNSDAQFIESAELRVADVCRFFGVPPHLVFAGKQSYASNEQNSLEYVKYSLLADVTQREQEDSHKLLLPSERQSMLRIKRELKVYLRGDTAAQAAWYTAMRGLGAYNADEIRGSEDLGTIPGGHAYLASLNYVPLDKFEELSVLRAAGGAQGAKEEV